MPLNQGCLTAIQFASVQGVWSEVLIYSRSHMFYGNITEGTLLECSENLELVILVT